MHLHLVLVSSSFLHQASRIQSDTSVGWGLSIDFGFAVHSYDAPGVNLLVHPSIIGLLSILPTERHSMYEGDLLSSWADRAS